MLSSNTPWVGVISKPCKKGLSILENPKNKDIIEKLCQRPEAASIERLANCDNIYSVRVNGSDRILFTYIYDSDDHHKKPYIYLIQDLKEEVTGGHDYHDSKYIKNENLVKQQLCKPEIQEHIAKQVAAIAQQQTNQATSSSSSSTASTSDIKKQPKAGKYQKRSKGKQKKSKKQEKNEASTAQKPRFRIKKMEYDKETGLPFPLAPEQKDAANVTAPCLYYGPPGAGKTIIVLKAMKKAAQSGKRTIYLTQNPGLVREYAEKFSHDLVPVVDPSHADAATLFKDNVFGFMANTNSKNKTPALICTYETLLWLEEQKKPEKDRRTFMTKDAYQAFLVKEAKRLEKFNVSIEMISHAYLMIGGFTEATFLELGKKDPTIGGADKIELRKALWESYQHLQHQLNNLKLMHGKFTPLSNDYNDVEAFIDEAQDDSFCQLISINEKIPHSRYCFDDDQNITDKVFQKDKFLLEINPSLKNKKRVLTDHYRCPEEVTKGAMRYRMLKNYIHGANDSVNSNGCNKRKGHQLWVEMSPEIDDKIKQDCAKTNEIAIVVPECFKAEAIEKFGAGSVFTVKEIKGLQFKHIVLYRFLEDPAKKSMLKAVNQELPDDPSTIKEKKARDEKRGQNEMDLLWNDLFTAKTRALEGYIMYGNYPEAENKKKTADHEMEHGAGKVKKFLRYMPDTNTYIPIDNTIKVDIKYNITTAEGWKSTAVKYIRKMQDDNESQARSAYRQYLQLSGTDLKKLTVQKFDDQFNAFKLEALHNFQTTVTAPVDHPKPTKNERNTKFEVESDEETQETNAEVEVGERKNRKRNKKKNKNKNKKIKSPITTENKISSTLTTQTNAESSLDDTTSAPSAMTATTAHAASSATVVSTVTQNVSIHQPVEATSNTLVTQPVKSNNETKTNLTPQQSEYLIKFCEQFSTTKLEALFSKDSFTCLTYLFASPIPYNGITQSLFHHIMVNNNQKNIFIDFLQDDKKLEKLLPLTLKKLSKPIQEGVSELIQSVIQTKNQFMLQSIRCATNVGNVELAYELWDSFKDKINKKHLPSLLLFASHKGCVNIVKELLTTYKIDVNFRDIDHNSAIQCAATHGKKDVMELLLKHKANINLKSSNNATPFITAVLNGHADIVQVLLEHGVSVHELSPNGSSALYMACYNGCIDVVKLLLERGVNVNQVNNNFVTPLHAAAHQGHEEIVKLLLDHQATIDSSDNLGDTPLCMAINQGHAKVVKILLDTGANVNHQTNVNEGPLFLAGGHANSSNNTEILELLLETNQIDLNIKTIYDYTLLEFAKSVNDTAIINILENYSKKIAASSENQSSQHADDKNAKVNNIDKIKNFLPLFSSSFSENKLTALFSARTEIIFKFLFEVKFDYQGKTCNLITHICKDENKKTMFINKLLTNNKMMLKLLPNNLMELSSDIQQGMNKIFELHLNLISRGLGYALDENRVQVCEYLWNTYKNIFRTNQSYLSNICVASAGAGSLVILQELITSFKVDVNAVSEGCCALSSAVKNGHEAIVKFLLNHHADVNGINSQNNYSPLMIAAEKGHTEIVKLLLGHGATIHYRALNIAICGGHKEVVDILLAKKDNLDVLDFNGSFLLAASLGYTDIVNVFLNHAHIYGISKDNYSEALCLSEALCMAASEGREETVKLLLSKGATIDNSKASSPLLAAINKNHDGVVKILMEHGADFKSICTPQKENVNQTNQSQVNLNPLSMFTKPYNPVTADLFELNQPERVVRAKQTKNKLL